MDELLATLSSELKSYLENDNYKRGKAALISCVVGVLCGYKLTYFRPKLIRKLNDEQWILFQSCAQRNLRSNDWTTLNELHDSKKSKKPNNSVLKSSKKSWKKPPKSVNKPKTKKSKQKMPALESM